MTKIYNSHTYKYFPTPTKYFPTLTNIFPHSTYPYWSSCFDLRIASGSCDEFEDVDDKEDSDDSDIETLDIDDDDVVEEIMVSSAPATSDTAAAAAAAGSKLRGLPPGITITTVVDSGIPILSITGCNFSNEVMGSILASHHVIVKDVRIYTCCRYVRCATH